MSHSTREARAAYRRQHYAANIEKYRQQDRDRKERYGGTCLTCGARTDGSNGPAAAPLYCYRCAPAAHSIWDRPSIISAIRLYAHRHGEPPTATAWNATMARERGLAERSSDYPGVNTVLKHFGTWNKAISAAGFEPRRVGQRRYR
jgi:hypothetical protein